MQPSRMYVCVCTHTYIHLYVHRYICHTHVQERERTGAEESGWSEQALILLLSGAELLSKGVQRVTQLLKSQMEIYLRSV